MYSTATRRQFLDLIKNSQKLPGKPKIIHVKTVEDAEKAGSPYYVVGTVPDFEAETQAEKDVVAMLNVSLSKAEQKGILFDLCFKPRRTRMIKAGSKLGWRTVEGIHVTAIK